MIQELTESGNKPRGRPRKTPKDDPQEDKRARGRQAQRTYMQRKQAETDRLQRRIASLEDAVECMSDEFLRFGERVLDSSHAAFHSRALDDLKRAMEKFLSIARAAEAVAADDEEPHVLELMLATSVSSTRVEPMQGSSTRPPSPAGQPCISEQLGIQMPFNLSTLFPPSSSTLPDIHTSTNAGHFSPRLTYGLLSNSPLQDTALSSLWTHYVIAGPNSLAMRLYTQTLSLMSKALSGEIINPGFIPSIGRFRFKYETPTDFIELARGQLSRMSIGDSDVELGANPNQGPAADGGMVLFGPEHPVMTAALRANIHSDVNYTVGSMAEWLDPWNAQQYINARWNLHCSFSTASVLPSYTSPPQQPSPFQSAPSELHEIDISGFFSDAELSANWDVVLDVQPLAEKLIREAVCFGEGPRFFKENIDGAVRGFLGYGDGREEVFV